MYFISSCHDGTYRRGITGWLFENPKGVATRVSTDRGTPGVGTRSNFPGCLVPSSSECDKETLLLFALQLEDADLVAVYEAVRLVLLVEPRIPEEPCVDRADPCLELDIAELAREEEDGLRDINEPSPCSLDLVSRLQDVDITLLWCWTASWATPKLLRWAWLTKWRPIVLELCQFSA